MTHAALAPVRTQKTTGMMGVVGGRAAFCRRLDCTPRMLHAWHLASVLAMLADPASA